jgi:peptidoglycan hydrolase-like protein with peptidoglycan-binding domain
MQHAARRLLPIVVATVLYLSAAPGVFALASRYPTQSLGDRGSDVVAVQGFLIARGYAITLDGVYGIATRAAVADFQASKGLAADGVVGDATWLKLLFSVSPATSGVPVQVLQRELNAKRRAHLSVNGIYDQPTKKAIIAFQKHMLLKPTGNFSAQTWRWLLWHFQTPRFNTSSLCDYSVGNGAANWGTGAAIGGLEAAAAAFAKTGHGRVAVGDVGKEHGGDIAGHQTHEVGLDVDVRPIRKNDNQCSFGTNWRSSSYDRKATRALIKAIRATAPGHVKLIYFNDPVLIKEGLTKRFSGHDDHMHIRYCEAFHVNKPYRC